MAVSKLNSIKGRYKKQEQEEKQKYLERTGKKVARGFKDSEEFKRVQKNKTNAIYRYNKKAKEREVTKLLREDRNAFEVLEKSKGLADVDGFENIKDLGVESPFFVALNYGTDEDTIAKDKFDLMKATGEKFQVVFDDTAIGGESKFYNTEAAYDKQLQILSKKCSKHQTKEGSYPHITFSTGEYNGVLTMVIRVELIEYTPKPKKKK